MAIESLLKIWLVPLVPTYGVLLLLLPHQQKWSQCRSPLSQEGHSGFQYLGFFALRLVSKLWFCSLCSLLCYLGVGGDECLRLFYILTRKESSLSFLIVMRGTGFLTNALGTIRNHPYDSIRQNTINLGNCHAMRWWECPGARQGQGLQESSHLGRQQSTVQENTGFRSRSIASSL